MLLFSWTPTITMPMFSTFVIHFKIVYFLVACHLFMWGRGKDGKCCIYCVCRIGVILLSLALGFMMLSKVFSCFLLVIVACFIHKIAKTPPKDQND